MRALGGLALALLAAAGGAQAAPPCPAVPFEGVCEGAVVRWCEGGADRSLDCAPLGLCCGWTDGGAGCVTCGTCTDACAEGEAGCSAEGTHAWTCSAGEGGCRERSWTTCAGSVCAGGTCGGTPPGAGPGCPTTCEIGARGCGDDVTAWECVEPAPGACPQKKTTVCVDGEACFDGECHPVAGAAPDEAPAEEGCGTGGSLPAGAALLAAVAALFALATAARSGGR